MSRNRLVNAASPLPRAGRTASGRVWALDALRGLAILLVVFYHVLWDLGHFGFLEMDVATGGWLLLARSFGALFLAVAGVSLSLERSRQRARPDGGVRPDGRGRIVWRRSFHRGLKIFGWGMAITLVTRLVLGEGFVIFGILHLIGVAVMLSPLFMPLRGWNVALGAAILLAGLALRQATPSLNWGIPLGLSPPDIYMVDYYPIFPWMGVVMLGAAAGRWLFPEGRARFTLPQGDGPVGRALATLGRHSLLIYLVHQPVLFFVLFIGSQIRETL